MSVKVLILIENDSHKISSVQTNDVIEAWKPHLIALDKENSKSQIIDFAVLYDTKMDSKGIEIIEKYQNLVKGAEGAMELEWRTNFYNNGCIWNII